jgi:hypothetical protein
MWSSSEPSPSGVDFRHQRDLGRIVAVMGQRMVCVRHTDLGIHAGILFLPEHEGDHSGQIRPQRQQLQLEHQAHVLFERGGRPLRLIGERQLHIALLFGPLNPPLDVPDRFGVIVDLAPIVRPQPSPEIGQPFGHRIENAPLLFESSEPRRRRRAGVAEQALEHRTRVVLHRQRHRRCAPGDRVRVGAAQAARALAGIARSVRGQLQ